MVKPNSLAKPLVPKGIPLGIKVCIYIPLLFLENFQCEIGLKKKTGSRNTHILFESLRDQVLPIIPT